jgi:hypothetical protein
MGARSALELARRYHWLLKKQAGGFVGKKVLAKQTPLLSAENVRVLTLPMVYLLIYVFIHLLQIYVLEADEGMRADFHLDRFVEKFHAGILSAITIGVCSALLMLSLSTALRFRVHELAIAAPGSLFGLFSIFLSGQILVLVAGHVSIFVSAVANREAAADVAGEPSAQMPLSVYANAADYVLVVTIFVALLSLWAFERYLGGVYVRIEKIFPNRAGHERDHVRVLATLAIIPLVFILVKLGVGFAFSKVIHGPTVSIFVGALELVVFVYTVVVSMQRSKSEPNP